MIKLPLSKLYRNIIYYFLFFCANINVATAQFTTTQSILHSKNVNDSFEIHLSIPKNFDKKPCNVVYYLDANIKSGKKIRELINDSNKAKNLSHTVFVGIGHIGNFHALRQRDFIPTNLKNKKGNAEAFYNFLKQQLLPFIQQKFTVQSSSIIGHSFGGLFVMYTMFKREELFNNYFALSPSLWVNNNAIYSFDTKQNAFAKPMFLLLTTGDLENLNYIKKCCVKMNAYLHKMDYQNVKVELKQIPYGYHNTSVAPTIKYILQTCLTNNP